MLRIRTYALTAAALVVLLAVAVPLTGCAEATDSVAPQGPARAIQPDPADLATPEAAVASYLDWISYAYLISDSSVATQTMTAWEGVRVDSYVELNRQQGRGIEQSLTQFQVTAVSSAEPTSTIQTNEEWEYRYFDPETFEYLSDSLSASYEAIYTLILDGERWLVDSVEATPLSEVQ